MFCKNSFAVSKSLSFIPVSFCCDFKADVDPQNGEQAIIGLLMLDKYAKFLYNETRKIFRLKLYNAENVLSIQNTKKISP